MTDISTATVAVSMPWNTSRGDVNSRAIGVREA
jgi:hypothetical protein